MGLDEINAAPDERLTARGSAVIRKPVRQSAECETTFCNPM